LQRGGRFEHLVRRIRRHPHDRCLPRQLPKALVESKRVKAPTCPLRAGALAGGLAATSRGTLERPDYRPAQARLRWPDQIPVGSVSAGDSVREVVG
jgi:hypothetical protein